MSMAPVTYVWFTSLNAILIVPNNAGSDGSARTATSLVKELIARMSISVLAKIGMNLSSSNIYQQNLVA